MTNVTSFSITQLNKENGRKTEGKRKENGRKTEGKRKENGIKTGSYTSELGMKQYTNHCIG